MKETKIKCPRCGTINIPKDINLFNDLLKRVDFIGMKCYECGAEVTYYKDGRVTYSTDS